MSQETGEQILDTLQEIRDSQREIISTLGASAIAEELLQKSGAKVEESIGLQREALRRQRSITRVAIPGILACIVALLHLVMRYL